MSTLLKALRRADQPQFTPHMPLMGLPISQEEEPNRRWIWWLLAPLALLMGAGANYGWHLYHLKPIEQRVEIKELVTPPFVRVEPKSMVTRPLPPPLPEPVVVPKAAAPAQATPAASNDGQSLAERIMQALNNTPLQEESSPAPAASSPQAMPLSALDPALKQQVPPLSYGAHNYSSDPAKRAVVINGRELHEGSEVAPGVTLVAIAQDYIILQVGNQHASLKALQDWRG
ncbi:GspB family T2SS assembly factor variant ExeB [Aeromonas aquatica]|uniref:GspB family T2SS assembly factor variant ExeB n=1 Tax=Aeromonas aquatica TaxID=558964 RepID=UPI00286F45BF|nr:GspB family T2SS assembly factor variant ExeB [Aeromonas aquatica]